MPPKSQVKWQEIARRGRNHAVLCVDWLAESFKQKTIEKKMKWGFSPKSYRQFNEARWLHEEDVKKYHQAIRNSEKKKPGYLLQKVKEYERLVDRIRKWGTLASKKDFKKLTNLELEKIFENYIELYIESNGFLYNYLFINDYLASELSDALMQKQPDTQKQMADLYALISPAKKSEARQEKEAIVKLAQKAKSQKLKFTSQAWQSLVKKHLEKFAHLNRYIYYGASYTPKDIARRVKDLLKGQHLKKAIRELKDSEYSEAEVSKLIKGYGFDKQTVLKIQAARYWAYVPPYWDETFIYLVHQLMPFFKEIGYRIGVKYTELVEMRVSEIYDFLEKDKKATATFKKELSRRYLDSALVFEKGKIVLLTGQALRNYYQQEKQASKDSQVSLKNNELRGQPASPGKASGKVSVVHSVNEVSKVKKGEILVTASTTPMHVPAMEKAAAIIADEGGLLSHAAIVSREMGVPCVVGTKVATRALQDGDEVEVDAVKGIIKKL